jgi:hypothetical protein
MSSRKKNAAPPPPKKPARPAAPPPATVDLDALLMVGTERMCIDCEQNDNTAFMAEVIDPP